MVCQLQRHLMGLAIYLGYSNTSVVGQIFERPVVFVCGQFAGKCNDVELA